MPERGRGTNRCGRRGMAALSFCTISERVLQDRRPGECRVNYETRARLAPNDEDLRHNLQLVNLQLTDRIEPAPRLFPLDTWDGIESVALAGRHDGGRVSLLTSVFWVRSRRSSLPDLTGHDGSGVIAGGVRDSFFIFTAVLFVAKLNDIGIGTMRPW